MHAVAVPDEERNPDSDDSDLDQANEQGCRTGVSYWETKGISAIDIAIVRNRCCPYAPSVRGPTGR